jgi:hypothetical protein
MWLVVEYTVKRCGKAEEIFVVIGLLLNALKGN